MDFHGQPELMQLVVVGGMFSLKAITTSSLLSIFFLPFVFFLKTDPVN